MDESDRFPADVYERVQQERRDKRAKLLQNMRAAMVEALAADCWLWDQWHATLTAQLLRELPAGFRLEQAKDNGPFKGYADSPFAADLKLNETCRYRLKLKPAN